MRLKKSNILNTVIKKEVCLGCGLCECCFPEKITMSRLKGYYSPLVVKALDNDEQKQFEQVCPAVNLAMGPSDTKKDFVEGIGYYVGYYHGYSSDAKIRYEAATGGGITGYLVFLLQEKIVDAILQIRTGESAYDCIAVVSEGMEDVIECKGSRYAPSCLLSKLKVILDSYQRVAIVGKPCDFRAIKLFLLRYPEYASRVIQKINFLCGGTPKIEGTYKILDALGCNDYSLVDKISYRGYGWPGNFNASVKESDKKYSMSYAESWGEYLGKTVLLGCKLCADSVGDCADISFGDAWETDNKGFPLFNEGEGQDLIITRTECADNLLKLAFIKGYLCLSEADVAEFCKIQPSQYIRRTTVGYKILAAICMGIPYRHIDWNYIKKNTLKKMRMTKKIKVYLGTVKRILKNN